MPVPQNYGTGFHALFLGSAGGAHRVYRNCVGDPYVEWQGLLRCHAKKQHADRESMVCLTPQAGNHEDYSPFAVCQPATINYGPMDRRKFLGVAAASPLLARPAGDPVYHVVTRFKPAAVPGMPGPHPGQVVRVRSESSVDAATGQVNRDAVKQM